MIAVIITDVMLTVCFAGVLFGQWMMICNNRCHADIIKVLEAIRHRPVTGGAVIKALNGVTYNAHMHARALFRDPWALYDPIVKDAIDNPRTEMMMGIERVPVNTEPPPRMN